MAGPKNGNHGATSACLDVSIVRAAMKCYMLRMIPLFAIASSSTGGRKGGGQLEHIGVRESERERGLAAVGNAGVLLLPPLPRGFCRAV